MQQQQQQQSAATIYTEFIKKVNRQISAHGYDQADPFREQAVCAAVLVPEQHMDRFLDSIEDMLMFRKGLYNKSKSYLADFSGYNLKTNVDLLRFNTHVKGMAAHSQWPELSAETQFIEKVNRLISSHGYDQADPFREPAVCAAELVPAQHMDRFLETIEDMLMFRKGLYNKSESHYPDFSGYNLKTNDELVRFNAYVYGMDAHSQWPEQPADEA
jgi:hypothetical protein